MQETDIILYAFIAFLLILMQKFGVKAFYFLKNENQKAINSIEESKKLLSDAQQLLKEQQNKMQHLNAELQLLKEDYEKHLSEIDARYNKKMLETIEYKKHQFIADIQNEKQKIVHETKTSIINTIIDSFKDKK